MSMWDATRDPAYGNTLTWSAELQPEGMKAGGDHAVKLVDPTEEGRSSPFVCL
jgi:hypothetical protein